MPYIRKICVAGKTIEISKYHSARWNCKGEKRAVRENETSVQQEKINLRHASERLRLLMNANFVDGDSYLTLDMRKEVRPYNSRDLQRMASDFVKAVKKMLKKKNPQMIFKYIYCKEIGPRGAAHLHMVTNVRDMEIIRACWKWGAIHLDPLNTDGQYADLAEYFIKYADKTIRTEGKQVGKKWYPSYNLEEPLVEKQVIRNVDTYNERITLPKKYGDIMKYYVEGDSVMQGVNADGYGYFSYILHRIPENPFAYRERPDLTEQALEGGKRDAGG